MLFNYRIDVLQWISILHGYSKNNKFFSAAYKGDYLQLGYLLWFDIIVHFIIQKLKNRYTFLKKYTDWAKLNPLILTEQEETKSRYFPPIKTVSTIVRPANNRWKFLFSRHRSKTWTDRMLATNPNVPITVILMPWI